jgi:hypothetical protein
MSIDSFLAKVALVILNPLIVFGFLVALLYFFFGIFQFVMSARSDTDREKGKQGILWGLVGMLVMFSAFGIIHIILNTFGIPTSSTSSSTSQSTYLSQLLNG